MLQSINAAARKLYDPASTLANAKGIPVERRHTAPIAMPVGSFKLPNGITVNASRFEGFTTLIRDCERRVTENPKGTRQAFHELAQKLIDFHIEEQRALHSHAQDLGRPPAERMAKSRAGWRKAFAADPEIGGKRKDTTISRTRALMELYGKSVGPERLQALRDFLTEYGGGDHPEVLRFVHWAATRLGSKAR